MSWRSDLASYVARFVALLFGLLIAYLVISQLWGCASAEDAYRAELLRCVDKARTLPESKACRASVDARWGISDGGVDQ